MHEVCVQDAPRLALFWSSRASNGVPPASMEGPPSSKDSVTHSPGGDIASPVSDRVLVPVACWGRLGD